MDMAVIFRLDPRNAGQARIALRDSKPLELREDIAPMVIGGLYRSSFYLVIASNMAQSQEDMQRHLKAHEIPFSEAVTLSTGEMVRLGSHTRFVGIEPGMVRDVANNRGWPVLYRHDANALVLSQSVVAVRYPQITVAQSFIDIDHALRS